MSRRSLFALIAVVTGVLLLVGFISSWFIIDRVVRGPKFQSRIEEAATQALQRPVTIGELKWQRWPSWILTGHNVQLWDDSSKKRLMAEAEVIQVHLTLLSFYRLSVGVADMKLIRPRFYFRQDDRHVWNLKRLLENLPRRSKEPKRLWGRLLFDRFSIQDGLLTAESERTSPLLISPLLIQGQGELKMRGRFSFELAAQVAKSSTTVKLPMGLGADTSLRIAGLYVPSSTSSFTGVLQSSTTKVEFKCALITSPRFKVTLHLPSAKYQSTSFQNIHAVVRRKEGNYTVDRTEVKGLGGTIVAQGAYFPSTSSSSFNVSWKTEGVQAQDLFRLIGSSLEVRGNLDSEGHIESGIGGSFLPSMDGEMKFSLKDGWFGNATGVLKILSKLNLTTLITEVKGDHRSRVPFEETHGTLKFEKGMASTAEPFVLENKTLQMAFMGTADLPKQSVDGKIVLNILMVTDEIIQNIPIVREILLGEGKGLTPIWLSVKGSISDPDIKILSGKSIASPIWNTIGNIFRLPETLIKKVTGK